MSARFPARASRRLPPMPRTVTLTASDTPGTPGRPLDLDFHQVRLADMFDLLAFELAAPIMFDGDLATTVDVQAQHEPAIDVLDDLVAMVNAERAEVPAIELVPTGGRTDAAALGGDPLSLHFQSAPMRDVLHLLEPRLHMPIGYLAPPPSSGEPQPDPLITLTVDNITAGAALEQVLAQTSLSYQLTTGFVVTPLPP